MLFARFKTSTRMTLTFTLFTSVLLCIFVIVLNAYYFYNWRFDEGNEVIDRTGKLADYVFRTENESGALTSERTDQFFKRILEQWGMVQTNEGGSFISPEWNKEKPNALWLYQSGANWYIRYTFPFRKIGTIGLPYDITEHIHGQVSLLRTSILSIIVFLIIIAFASLFFTRFSLRSLSRIIQYTHSFKINSPLPEFPVSGPENDEFVIVAGAISEAFKKIQSQTEVLQQFSTDAAHEFKTPLMVLRSEIDYALKSGEYRTGLENIREQIDVLDTMVVTLLTIARIEKGPVEEEKVNISELFEETIAEEERIFSGKHLDIIKNIPKNRSISSNRSMLRIVIVNLLDNAFKYTDAGEIHITLDADGFSIRDTGIGIDKENLDRIWDRLYREDSSRGVQTGHWLGLFLVKSIIEKLGYTIRVESEKGRGSTFLVRF